jgi:phage/plasmid-associated DNA primase
MDNIGRFISERLARRVGSKIKTTDVYNAYWYWCINEGINEKYRLARPRFYDELEKHDIKWHKSNGERYYVGYEILPDSDDNLEDDNDNGNEDDESEVPF